MTFPIQVGPATITINRDDRVLVCQPDGSILGTAEDGFFTRDTRFVSGYRLLINGRRPILLTAGAPRCCRATRSRCRSSRPASAGCRTDGDGSRIYVDPALPDWLPDLEISDLRAGRGALSLRLHDGEVTVTRNTTGFDVRHEAPPRVTGRAAVGS